MTHCRNGIAATAIHMAIVALAGTARPLPRRTLTTASCDGVSLALAVIAVWVAFSTAR